MTFLIDDVRQALSPNVQLQQGEIALPLWSSGSVAGIGVDFEGSMTLVMRSCSNSNAVSGRHFRYMPNTELHIRDRGLVESVSVLIVQQRDTATADLDAIAEVFLGLLEVSFDPAVILSDIVSQLSELFETGRVKALSRDQEVGLIGELLVILGAPDKEFAVSAWRSGDRDRFDFSSHSERVEVKTTTGVDRVHHFNSTQIPGPTDCRVIVASVVLSLVEVGTTLRQLVDLVTGQLTSAVSRSELLAKTGAVVSWGEQDSALCFDLRTSARTARFISSADVPRPVQSPGVLSMSWSALISESDEAVAVGALSRAILPRNLSHSRTS